MASHFPRDGLARTEASEPEGLTVTSSGADGLTSILARNIHALDVRRKQEQASASKQHRVADALTRFAGTMAFVYVHLVVVGLWIVLNLGWPKGMLRFDPTFSILANVASVEAIFLATFVLISQSHPAQVHGASYAVAQTWLAIPLRILRHTPCARPARRERSRR